MDLNKLDHEEWTDEESAFRRGFVQGVCAAQEGKCTYQEAIEWKNSNMCTCPPGTGLSGTFLPNLTKHLEINKEDKRQLGL